MIKVKRTREQKRTSGIYYAIMNDDTTFRLFGTTTEFIIWEIFAERREYLEAICEYVKVGPYA